MKNVAVILSGGIGARLGETMPKQFLKLAGKKVIEHTLDVFQNHPLIDEIAVVSHIDYIRDIEDICIHNQYDKLKRILIGGKERYQSSLAAINAYEGNVNLIFHDSVRPLVNERIITDCIRALDRYDAVDVAVPTTDTIIQVDENNEIKSIPKRALLRNGQTPQAFRLSVIKQAYELALNDPNFQTTDDCGVVLKYLPSVPIYVVKGEQFNMKLTYKEDLFLLDKLFQLRSISINDNELSAETLSLIKYKIIVIFGGSYGIGLEISNICKEVGAKVYSFSRSTGVNVTDEISIRKALEEVYNVEGRIDCVVNTAGVLERMPLEIMKYDDIRNDINVNYNGCINVAKESFKYLKASKGGMIFFTSSSYTRGRSLYSLYSSSKAAIVNLVQALSEEWHDYKIRINCINPERTKTPMRIRNFGNEPENTLLDPQTVAIVSINTMFANMTGEVIDVKRKGQS